MVKHPMHLDTVFHSLSDPIRRDILERVTHKEWSVGELGELHEVSFAAVSKHVKVLEEAGLIKKRKEGRHHMISLAPKALKEADAYLERYRRMWQSRYDKLDALLKDK